MQNVSPRTIQNLTYEQNETTKLLSTLQLLSKLEQGEQSAREKGWLSADEVEAALGV